MKKIWPLLILMIIPALTLTESGCHNPSKGKADTLKIARDTTLNALTANEAAQGWKLLFDGKSFANWKGFKTDSIPSRWHIKDGLLFTEGKKEIKSDKELTLDIITVEEFENFELSWEWRMSPQGNSGVIYHVLEGKYPETFATGPEYQLLDDKGYPEKLKDSQYTASDYDMYPAVNSKLNPVGEWNKGLIKVNGSHVEHLLNGTRVVEYELWSPDWKARVQNSKWKDYPEYGLVKTGHIALQDHGSEVYFRNIKIRKL